MAKITMDMTIHEVLTTCPAVAEVLMSYGMHCLGCPSARGEALGQAAMVHGIDAEEMLDSINTFMDEQGL